MKKLSRFVVRVTSQRQYDIATKFFLRASRRPFNSGGAQSMSIFSVLYVGMYGRTVNVGTERFVHERVVEFNQMDQLADTPTRVAALKASGWTPVVRTVRPLVQFTYPSRDKFPTRTVRSVRLIKADAKYYIGVEILADNSFKFKKFLKNKATNFEVLEF